MLHLEDVLQRLYDSEINVTVTMLWDGGFDFAFASYLEVGEIHSCKTAAELADAIHRTALEKYPKSDYAKTHKRPN